MIFEKLMLPTWLAFTRQGSVEDRNVFRVVSVCLLYFREMCLWDVNDGRCIEFTKLACTHTGIQVSTGVLQSRAWEL